MSENDPDAKRTRMMESGLARLQSDFDPLF